MNSETVSARFNAEILSKIDKLVESGEFGSRGEFVQYAVRIILKQCEDGWRRLPPPRLKGPDAALVLRTIAPRQI